MTLALPAVAQQPTVRALPDDESQAELGVEPDPFLARLLAPSPPVQVRTVPPPSKLDIAAWNLRHLTEAEAEALRQQKSEKACQPHQQTGRSGGGCGKDNN